LGSVEGESEEKERLAGSSSFKVSFGFIEEADIKAFFFGVEKVKELAILSILEAVVF
jgi:hypothetical protein